MIVGRPSFFELFHGGPGWIRTSDQDVMSILL
jgi:hypothetical protein